MPKKIEETNYSRRKLLKKRRTLIVLYSLVGLIAAMLLYFSTTPERIVSLKNPQISIERYIFRGWGGDNNSAGLIELSGNISPRTIKDNCILILSRGPGDAPWTIQVEKEKNSKQFQPLCIETIGNSGYWEVTTYIGDRHNYPYQKEFSIIAVLVRLDTVKKVDWMSYAYSGIIPEFKTRSQVESLLAGATWSSPIEITLHREDTKNK